MFIVCLSVKDPTYLAARNVLPKDPSGMSRTRSHTSEVTDTDAFCFTFFLDLEGVTELVSGKEYTCKFAVVAMISCSGM